jgi:hypothetical protein
MTAKKYSSPGPVIGDHVFTVTYEENGELRTGTVTLHGLLEGEAERVVDRTMQPVSGEPRTIHRTGPKRFGLGSGMTAES